MEKIKIVILAAGYGKRMGHELPKVLIPLRGKPLIIHLLDAVKKSGVCEEPVIVVGQGRELVMKTLGEKYEYVIQEEQLGTGHAVSCAKDSCRYREQIVVLQGDMPFIKAETIKNLVERHINTGAKITFTTTLVPDFLDWRKALISFGRVLRKNGEIWIREYKDASPEEREKREVNAGSYVFEAGWLWNNLEKVMNKNTQGEYYLTDLLRIASDGKEKIETLKIDLREALGANTKEELEILEQLAYNQNS